MVKQTQQVHEAEALRYAPIITTMTDAAAKTLLAASTLLTLPAGKVLLSQAQVPSAVYLVQTGILRHIYYNATGTDAGLGMIGSGHWVGLGSLYGLPPSGTVEALVESRVHKIEPQTLHNIMADNPKIAGAFHALTLQQSLDTQKRLCQMMTLSVAERLAHCLLRLARDFGRETEQGLYLDVPLTRSHLADLVGTRLETVSRTLSQWEREGLVLSRRQKVWIVQQKQLASLTNGEAQ